VLHSRRQYSLTLKGTLCEVRGLEFIVYLDPPGTELLRAKNKIELPYTYYNKLRKL
jgi:hypothetical protein